MNNEDFFFDLSFLSYIGINNIPPSKLITLIGEARFLFSKAMNDKVSSIVRGNIEGFNDVYYKIFREP